MQRQSVQSRRSGRYHSQGRLVLNTKMLLTLSKKITQNKVVPQWFQQHAGSNCTLQRCFFFFFLANTFVSNFLFLKTNYRHNSGTIRCSFYCCFFFSLLSFDTAAFKNESFKVQRELVAALSLPGKQKRKVQENSFLQVGSKMIDGVEHPKAAILYVTRWWTMDQS